MIGGSGVIGCVVDARRRPVVWDPDPPAGGQDDARV